jgi:uncharacterized protein (TIGR03437 family)
MLRIFGLLTPSPAVSPEPVSTPASAGIQDSAPVSTASPVEPEPVAAPLAPSEKAAATPRASGPRLFVQSNYVAAVRAADGSILSHGVAAAPSEVIELYGTGFDLESSPKDGANSQASAEDATITVSIGGIPAQVEFAGRVGPRLFQIDVTVPAGLSGGDHPVVACLGGMRTNCGALLRVAKKSDPSPDAEGRYGRFLRRALKADPAAQGDARS